MKATRRDISRAGQRVAFRSLRKGPMVVFSAEPIRPEYDISPTKIWRVK